MPFFDSSAQGCSSKPKFFFYAIAFAASARGRSPRRCTLVSAAPLLPRCESVHFSQKSPICRFSIRARRVAARSQNFFFMPSPSLPALAVALLADVRWFRQLRYSQGASRSISHKNRLYAVFRFERAGLQLEAKIFFLCHRLRCQRSRSLSSQMYAGFGSSATPKVRVGPFLT